MSYLALYRKYRPATFSEVVGQEAVVKALQNQVKYQQIGHAYLFCGTRGTGKTSLAKVFARAVNCEYPIEGNPCNRCTICKSGEENFNVIEIDAASNNSVDNIRDLREEVKYTPAQGRYKVYIIDEVHMLSQAAFNALLKTLEEPPEHVIFVLATTDPQKVLPTIVSRCQRYDFRRIMPEDIKGRLLEVCRKEGIEIEEEAAAYIARLSDGAMRDALSILDQCHAYYMGEAVTLGKVQEIMGAVDDTVFTTLTDLLKSGDAAGLLEKLSQVFASGRDALQLMLSWNQYLRNVLLAGLMGKGGEGLLEANRASFGEIERQGREIAPALLGHWIESFAKLEAELRLSSQKRILIEVMLIGLCSEAGAFGETKPEAPKEEAPKAQKAAPEAVQAATQPEPVKETPKEEPPKQEAPNGQEAAALWPKVRDRLMQESGTYATLRYIEMKPVDGSDGEVLEASSEIGIYTQQLLSNHEEKRKTIEERLSAEAGRPIRVRVKGEAVNPLKDNEDPLTRINMKIDFN